MASKELQAALEAARAAAELIRSLYQKNLSVRTKADASPVTEADVRAEELIRAILSELYVSPMIELQKEGRRVFVSA